MAIETSHGRAMVDIAGGRTRTTSDLANDPRAILVVATPREVFLDLYVATFRVMVAVTVLV